LAGFRRTIFGGWLINIHKDKWFAAETAALFPQM